MNIIIGCESSGTVREAFRARGHNAWSCDLLPADDDSYYHLQKDIFEVIKPNNGYVAWDLAIFHPPCTDLTVACSRLWKEKQADGRQAAALKFVGALMMAPIPRICIENPVGRISTAIRKPDQIIQPYEFGDDASKKTCLWLKGLPKLTIDPAKRVWGRMVPIIHHNQEGSFIRGYHERWANQTDSGQNKLTPGPDRWKERSKTYQGIADAMAEQWG
jgi:hypothetical protein